MRFSLVLAPDFANLPDDTEDSLFGSAGHQSAISTLYSGLPICAQRRGLPWFVATKLALLIFQAGRNLPRRIAPDIMIYPTLSLPYDPMALAVAMHGLPSLVIEVASPSTASGNDMHLFDQCAKPQLYERIGVDEYLAFDPTGVVLSQQIWARRRGPHGFERWEPEADCRWRSALGVSFAPQRMLLRVYDHNENLIPLSVEFDEMLVEQARQNAEKDRRLTELEAELCRLRGE
jgi:Uma2 family endonuclease